jgi:hypothetical protein
MAKLISPHDMIVLQMLKIRDLRVHPAIDFAWALRSKYQRIGDWQLDFAVEIMRKVEFCLTAKSRCLSPSLYTSESVRGCTPTCRIFLPVFI